CHIVLVVVDVIERNNVHRRSKLGCPGLAVVSVCYQRVPTSCANHGHERKLVVTMDHLNQDASEHLLETVSADAVSSLDEKGKLIIEQLQQDGRRSYSAIARAVGLSEAAVRQRITRLMKEQIVKIVAVTNPLQIGFSRQARSEEHTSELQSRFDL